VTGSYFPARSSRSISATVELDGKLLRFCDDAGGLIAEYPVARVRSSAPLAALRRRLDLPDGARFETDDNAGIASLLAAAGRVGPSTLLHRAERSIRWVIASLLFAAVVVALAILYGFPAAAGWLAGITPRPVMVAMSSQTLGTLDRIALSPSALSAAERRRSEALFRRMAAVARQPASTYRLLFREGGAVGPNALSLPDGTVIMTDELFRLARQDDELEGVFGHEIAHADRRHALQMLYETSLIPATIALITGDASQFGQMAAILPSLLIQASYSRGFEQQADDDSARMMLRIGANPAALGIFLLRMEKTVCGPSRCSAGWLGSHPDTAERAAKLRDEAMVKVGLPKR
jgi:Zn-dependent protease with chaperone function